MRNVAAVLAGASCLFVSCSKEGIPPCQDTYTYKIINRADFNPADCVAQARQAWDILNDAKLGAQHPQALKQYNHAVEQLVNYHQCRLQSFKAGFDNGYWKLPMESRFKGNFLLFNPQNYDRIIPAMDVANKGIFEERYVLDGIGVPVVGWVKPERVDNGEPYLYDAGMFHNMTAALWFRGKDAFLVFARRHNSESITLPGGTSFALAGDFSASKMLAWQVSEVDNRQFLSLLRPKNKAKQYGLILQEAYEPDKIPILTIHGLASSPYTFGDLTNRLDAHAEIRQNYQFWTFAYETGAPWILSAQKLRDQYNKFRDHVDPLRQNKKLDQMVIIAHSMGGLIARYNLSVNGDKMYDDVVKTMYSDPTAFKQRFAQETNNKGGELFRFKPLPAKRVIFIAVPHQGSNFASNWIGRLGQSLIELPGDVFNELTNIVTLSGDMLLVNPEKVFKMFPSVNQLSPDSPFLKSLNTLTLKPDLQVHSIIGNRGSRLPLQYTGDGIVRYTSSHVNFAKQEFIVPYRHSMTEEKRVYDHVWSIMQQDLQSNGLWKGLDSQHRGKLAPDPDKPRSNTKKNLLEQLRRY